MTLLSAIRKRPRGREAERLEEVKVTTKKYCRLERIVTEDDGLEAGVVSEVDTS